MFLQKKKSLWKGKPIHNHCPWRVDKKRIEFYNVKVSTALIVVEYLLNKIAELHV